MSRPESEVQAELVQILTSLAMSAGADLDDIKIVRMQYGPDPLKEALGLARGTAAGWWKRKTPPARA